MPAGVPLTTNFKDVNGTDLGIKFVEKEYLLDTYPSIYADILKDISGQVWGDGPNNGALPSGTTYYTIPCATFFSGSDWKSITTGAQSLGGNFFSVVKTDGTLWSWGENGSGRFGNGSNGGTSSSPVQTISAGTNWKFVTSSGFASTTAAIKTDGTLWLWGSGQYGILGNGDIGDHCSPVQTISAGTNWKTVTLGSNAAAGIKTDGTLWTWGNNNAGKLGDNSTTCRSSPVQVSGGGSTWCAVSFGRCHLLALKTDNTLWAVGCNTCGELGDQTLGIPSARSQLIQITGTTWCTIAAGNCMSAAIKTDGTLWTWGSNTPIGRLGINTSVGFRCSPVQTSAGGTSWKKVFVGCQSTVFAIKSDSSLWAWGCNQCGKLGLGGTANRSSPVKVSNGWTDIAAGDSTTIGIQSNEFILCDLTNFRFTDSAAGFTSTDFDDVYVRTCCYSEAGVWMWGNNFKCRLSISDGVAKSVPTQSSNLPGIGWKFIESDRKWYNSSFDEGGGGAAIKTDGTLWLWGSEAFGKLGNGISNDNTPFKASPVQTISTGTNWKIVSRGTDFTAALKTDGSLWLWGTNPNGELGTNDATSRCSPVQTISQGTNWCKIKVSGTFTTAIKTDGTLWTWGANGSGQLGDSTTIAKCSPIQTISQGTNWLDVAVGTFHALALKTDGTLWLWGSNTSRQLGTLTNVSHSSPVQTISQGSNWKKISANDNHSAAIKTDNSLWMWGNNTSGQLGNFNSSNTSSPTQIGPEKTWKDISLGCQCNSAAIKYDGTLWLWGRNQCGVLGDGTTIDRSSPVQTTVGGNNWKQIAAGTAMFALRENCW